MLAQSTAPAALLRMAHRCASNSGAHENSGVPQYSPISWDLQHHSLALFCTRLQSRLWVIAQTGLLHCWPAISLSDLLKFSTPAFHCFFVEAHQQNRRPDRQAEPLARIWHDTTKGSSNCAPSPTGLPNLSCWARHALSGPCPSSLCRARRAHFSCQPPEADCLDVEHCLFGIP